MEISGSIGIDLEMCPCRRNESLTMVVVDEYSKSPLLDGGGQLMDDNKQMEGNDIAIGEACERSTSHDIVVKGFGEEQHYFSLTYGFSSFSKHVKNGPMW